MSTSGFTAPDPGYEERVRTSFDLQTAMRTMGATLASVRPGAVEIQMPYSAGFTQQNGYLHAGVITAIVDSACGYAAFSLVPAGANVLTVEYKANFLAPARGDLFIATGRVLKAGRTIAVCQGEVRAQGGGAGDTVVAAMLATIMILRPS